MPHFDDRDGVARHLAHLGRRLVELAADPELATQVVGWQRQRAFRDLARVLTVPGREPRVRVRVRRGAGLVRGEGGL